MKKKKNGRWTGIREEGGEKIRMEEEAKSRKGMRRKRKEVEEVGKTENKERRRGEGEGRGKGSGRGGGKWEEKWVEDE